MKKSKVAYWTVWSTGSICSRCRTLKAALRSVKRCEKNGGGRHAIYKVQVVRAGKP